MGVCGGVGVCMCVRVYQQLTGKKAGLLSMSHNDSFPASLTHDLNDSPCTFLQLRTSHDLYYSPCATVQLHTSHDPYDSSCTTVQLRMRHDLYDSPM